MPDTQQCPACNSDTLWSDTYEGTTYKHCQDCTFCWDSRMEEKPDFLAIKAGEYNNIHRDWEETNND